MTTSDDGPNYSFPMSGFQSLQYTCLVLNPLFQSTYNMHAISTLVSHLVSADILTSPESCKIPSTSSPYFLTKNWHIVTSLNPVPSVFFLQANMYVDTHWWLNLCFDPPITSPKDHLRQFNSGFTKRLSINQDLRTRKATYQLTGVFEPESAWYIPSHH